MSTHWCRYERAGEVHFGQVSGDRILRVEGTPFGEHRVTRDSCAWTDVRWLPPVIPPTFYSAGVN